MPGLKVGNIKIIVKLLRPHQYVKNLLVFLPLFFGMKFLNFDRLLYTCLVFVCFSLIASAVYVFNDVYDVEEDKRHPEKRNRPVASGLVSKGEAYGIFFVLLFVGSILTLLTLPTEVSGVLLIYIVLNLLYTVKLKHISILDITVIAFGFVLRLFAGAAVGKIELSHWIIVMTFLLALFLALAKRRDDLLIFIADGKMLRKSIEGYNLIFVDTAMSIMAAVIIVSYVLYTVSAEVITRFHTDKLYLTTFFVILGVLRYLQVTFVKEESGDPSWILLHDRFLQCVVLGWLILFGLIIYR